MNGLVDYAGLFPPAKETMAGAAGKYGSYLSGPLRFALGRFIVPVSRLEEFAGAASREGRGEAWKLSVLAGEDVEADARAAREFNRAWTGWFEIDTIETMEARAQAVEGMTVYCEIPVNGDPAAIGRGVRAKVRMGGVTAEAFPTCEEVTRFLMRAAERRVAFKATAGLHHPVRGEHALTYEKDSARAMMHGFLNVFVAAALAWAGMGERVGDVMREEDAGAFAFGEDGLRWRDALLTTEQIAAARREFAISFGSCSFEDPVEDLRKLKIL